MAETSPEARRLKLLMDRRGLTATALGATTGLNKNTFSDLFSGKTQRPSKRTRDLLEDALGVTRGTLVDGGEDDPLLWDQMRLGESRLGEAALGRDLSKASPDELVGALLARIHKLQDEVRDLRSDAERERAREAARRAFLAEAAADGTPAERAMVQARERLVFASQEEGGWGSEEEARDVDLNDRIDALLYLRANPDLVRDAFANVTPLHRPDPRRAEWHDDRAARQIAELAEEIARRTEENTSVDDDGESE